MVVDREELKRIIDQMDEEDTAEVFDFIGYLKMKREKGNLFQMDVDSFSDDKELIRQIEKSRKDRVTGQIYDQEQGLKYLQSKVREFENGQNL